MKFCGTATVNCRILTEAIRTSLQALIEILPYLNQPIRLLGVIGLFSQGLSVNFGIPK